MNPKTFRHYLLRRAHRSFIPILVLACCTAGCQTANRSAAPKPAPGGLSGFWLHEEGDRSTLLMIYPAASPQSPFPRLTVQLMTQVKVKHDYQPTGMEFYNATLSAIDSATLLTLHPLAYGGEPDLSKTFHMLSKPAGDGIDVQSINESFDPLHKATDPEQAELAIRENVNQAVLYSGAARHYRRLDPQKDESRLRALLHMPMGETMFHH